MLKTFGVICIALTMLPGGASLAAQTNTTVSVDNEVYYILEQAELRGLCGPLPAVKPYSRKVIRRAVLEILGSGPEKLTEMERAILRRLSEDYTPAKPGLDMYERGAYHFLAHSPRQGIRFEGDAGAGLQLRGGIGGYAEEKDLVWGMDNIISAYIQGDIGENLSFKTHFLGAVAKAHRRETGRYDTYYPGFASDHEDAINRQITVHSQPLAFFPYTFRKHWDGFVVPPGEIGGAGLKPWPDTLSLGPGLLGEIAGTLFDDMVSIRFARVRREWGGMSNGRSLIFNAAAQPFMALETTVNPVYWFSFSALTGALEYFYADDLKASARTFQSAFSIEQLELNYKNYFHFDFGSTAVWSKRFELGYIFPNNMNFLYQDSVGDFDNMGFFFNLKGRVPGIGGVWFSFFADEMEPTTMVKPDFFKLDRNMYAFQAGVSINFPWLPFASVNFLYTKVEPYCYTHTRIFVPWYESEFEGDKVPMETSYTNNGESLGYYLPPNADEFLLRFASRVGGQFDVSAQYQMIRHGADYGSAAVDGSSFLSELDPDGRSDKDVLRKYFLQDGAYQWQQIFKIGAGYTFDKYPIRLFGEFGVVYTFYTNIEGKPNAGSPSAYTIVNTAEYPKSTAVLATLGVRFYPRNAF
ncbi:MAG: hypothetical protein LBD37_02525 [Treponema sp.]|jgi:hypothetical protein|nr:hypothetical protein [Treponema sp.]